MTRVWTPDVIHFALLIGTSATWLGVHLGLLKRALQARSLSGPARLACFWPPFTAYIAFRHGARLQALLWLTLVLVYVGLRWLH